MRFRRRAKALDVSRQEFWDTRPLRNPSLRWDRSKDGIVTVFISYERGRLASIFSRIPKEKQIMLDEVGSRVWNFCDGNYPMKKIAKALHQEYKLTIEEAEAALRTYFNQLSERGLVGFILPKEAQARFGKDQSRAK